MGNTVNLKPEEHPNIIGKVEEIRPGDTEMRFTKEQWLMAADNFANATPGICSIIQSISEEQKPGSGKQVVSEFALNVSMAIAAMTFVAEKCPGAVALVLRKVDVPPVTGDQPN